VTATTLPAIPRQRRAEMIAVLGSFLSGYEGAGGGEPDLRTWNPAGGSADNVSLQDLQRLRERTSDLIRNEPLAAGAQQTQLDSVVGTGLRLHATPRRDVLGMTRKEASAWARRAEWIWEACKDSLDIEGESSMRELQELVFLAPLERGDCFTIRRFRKRPSDVLGTKLQLIEADLVSNPNGRQNDITLRDGVEKDPVYGGPVAYWVADRYPNEALLHTGATDWTRVEAFGPVTGERVVLHHLRRRRKSLSRGIPLFAPVLRAFKQIGRFSGAELMAAVVNAMLTVVIESPEAGDEIPLTAENPDAVAITGGAWRGTAASEVKMGTGTVLGLKPGQKVTVVDPKRPNANFGPFADAVFMQISAAIGMPFEVFTKRFQSSYSAARAALIEFWRYVYGWREWLGESFLDPVYSWVIAEAVSTGLLEAPGFFDDPLLRRAYLAAEWIGDAPGQLDELKEAKAAELRLKLGITTLQQETAAITGGDWERNHEQRAEEVRRRRDDGLVDPTEEDLDEAETILNAPQDDE